ncbi:MAG: hypothetical protein CM15mP49_34060 [Actinomycetota bacterium]|nr:MAG: hypothetical protein CM15mP49_34060 [Actinomycetota bacterium]
MESIRNSEGEDTVQKYYWELGRRIHHDKDFMDFELDDVIDLNRCEQLITLKLLMTQRFDEEIRSRMDNGLF